MDGHSSRHQPHMLRNRGDGPALTYRPHKNWPRLADHSWSSGWQFAAAKHELGFGFGMNRFYRAGGLGDQKTCRLAEGISKNSFISCTRETPSPAYDGGGWDVISDDRETLVLPLRAFGLPQAVSILSRPWPAMEGTFLFCLLGVSRARVLKSTGMRLKQSRKHQGSSGRFTTTRSRSGM